MSPVAVFQADMGKINEYDKIMIENQKQIWISNNFFYISLHLIDALGMEFSAY